MESGASYKNGKRIPKEFLGAFKRGHRFAAREFIDEDYAHALLDRALAGDNEALKALEFITKYNNEVYRKYFRKDGTDFYQGQDRLDRQNELYAMKEDVMVRQTYELPIDRPPLFADEDTLIELIDIKIELERAKKQQKFVT